MQRFYQLTKLPCTPFIGPLLAPLTTILGDAIQTPLGRASFEVVDGAGALAKLVREGLSDLIRRTNAIDFR